MYRDATIHIIAIYVNKIEDIIQTSIMTFLIYFFQTNVKKCLKALNSGINHQICNQPLRVDHIKGISLLTETPFAQQVERLFIYFKF